MFQNIWSVLNLRQESSFMAFSSYWTTQIDY